MQVLDMNNHLNITNIPTDKLRVNDYNPNKLEGKKFDALKTSIVEDGFLQPVLVRPAENDEYVIIDGEHRFKILSEMGSPEIPCIIVDVDDLTAKAFTINMNNIRGESDRLKLAAVIKELRTRYSLEELEDRLGFSEKELKSFTELLDFDFDAFADESEQYEESLGMDDDTLSQSPLDKKREFTIPVNSVEEDLVKTAIETKKAISPKITPEQALVQICNEYLV